MKAKGRRRAFRKKVFSKVKSGIVSVDSRKQGVTSYVMATDMECGTHTRQGGNGKTEIMGGYQLGVLGQLAVRQAW